MRISSLLYYRRFVKDIRKIGFVLNPYDPCTANRILNGLQHTIVWHVDDIKSSHQNKEVNDNFLKWLERTYGENENEIELKYCPTLSVRKLIVLFHRCDEIIIES